MDAEKEKAEFHAEHQRKASIFSAAESKVQNMFLFMFNVYIILYI